MNRLLLIKMLILISGCASDFGFQSQSQNVVSMREFNFKSGISGTVPPGLCQIKQLQLLLKENINILFLKKLLNQKKNTAFMMKIINLKMEIKLKLLNANHFQKQKNLKLLRIQNDTSTN